jgi:hypothetical protein
MNRALLALMLAALLAVPSISFAAETKPADQEKFDAILIEINRYWRQTLKEDGYRYREPTALLIDERTDTGCGKVDPSVVAAYCPKDAAIILAPAEIDKIAREYGDFVPVVAVAHEWGHHIQASLGVPDQKTIREELQADCLAGAALGNAAALGLVDKGDIRQATDVTRDALGDPEWLPRDSDQAHGSGDQRVRNLLAGYEQGLSACGLEELLSAAAQTPTPEVTPEPMPPTPPAVDPAIATAEAVAAAEAAAAAATAAAEPIASDPASEAATQEQAGEQNRQEENPEQAPPPVEETPVTVEEIPAVQEIPAAPTEVAPAPVPAEPAPAEVETAPAAPAPASAGQSGPVTLSGKLVLDSAALQMIDGGCGGTGTLADVAAGLPVSVQDENGVDIGLGALGAGIMSLDSAHCSFEFVIQGLTPSPEWTVRIGDRAPVVYSEEDLLKAGYRIGMRLGDGS